jgi:hypothetical protein
MARKNKQKTIPRSGEQPSHIASGTEYGTTDFENSLEVY